MNTPFVTPLLDWNGVAPRFFEMLHEALTPEFIVNPREFSVTTGNSLGDVAAKYKIFGTQNSINLYADRLTIDLLDLLSGDYQVVLPIIRALDSSFSLKFPECQPKTIDSIFYEQIELVDTTVTDYLARYAIPKVDDVFGKIGNVHIPSGRFVAMDSNTTWHLLCNVERSDSLPEGLFLHLEIRLLKLNANDSFDHKLERIKQIFTMCLLSLEIELVSAE